MSTALRVERMDLADMPAERYASLVGSSFFASSGFTALWRERGGRPVVWAAETRGEIAAILPGVEFRRGPLVRFASMPDGCYSGVFVDDRRSMSRPETARLLTERLQHQGYFRIDLFDFDDSLQEPDGFEPKLCEARLIDIGDPGWLPPDAKLQSQLRRSWREGTVVERFRWQQHGRAFMELVRSTYLRHGVRVRYSPAFFRGLAELAEADSRIRWLWCNGHGIPACSHIYFMQGNTLIAWQSYFDKRMSSWKPNACTRMAAVRWAQAQGATCLNLGSTPTYATGLAAYKRRWGGRQVFFKVYVRDLWGLRKRLSTSRGSGTAVMARPRSQEAKPSIPGRPL